MSERTVRNILRYLVWERKIGELKLNSILQTYIGDEIKFNKLKENIAKMREELEKFKNNENT